MQDSKKALMLTQVGMESDFKSMKASCAAAILQIKFHLIYLMTLWCNLSALYLLWQQTKQTGMN